MFVDISCTQRCKTGKNACGDAFRVHRHTGSGRVIGVLSDGLGSGVKANILALMTSTMLLGFIERDVPIRIASETMMNSLPVDKIRGVSYATFSAIDCTDDGDVRIVEEGNPPFLWIRENSLLRPDTQELISASFPNRKLQICRLRAQLGDRIIFVSDGVTQSGLGRREFRTGWGREALTDFILGILAETPDISSHSLTEKILAQSAANDPGGKPGDDISACCVYYREPRRVLLFTGAPYDQNRDGEYARVFADFPGKKAVAGGTTSNIVSRELKRPITTPITRFFGMLPPVSVMDGVDLVTEGVLTLSRALDYLQKDAAYPPDAAGKMADFLLSADVIEVMLGGKINQANYDPSLPIQIGMRRDLVRKIADVLEQKYYKHVEIRFI